MTTIGDPRQAGEEGNVGDQRKAGETGPAGDPRPAGEAKVKATAKGDDEPKTTKKSASKSKS